MTSPDIPPILPRCSSCGAHLRTGFARCWLCHAELTTTVSEGSPLVVAELARPPEFSEAAEWIFKGVAALLALLAGLVILGASLESPAAGVTLAVVLLFPLSATLLRVQLQKQKHGRVSWGEKLATFILSTAVMLALLVLLAIAAFAAFFIWCLIEISR